MPIKATCAGCGKTYQVADTLAGTEAKCRRCGGVISIPQSQSATPDSPDDDWMADLSDAAEMSASARPAPSARRRKRSGSKSRRQSAGVSLPFTMDGKTITVAVGVGVMLLISLSVMLSGMPLWLKGRVVLGVALLMQIFGSLLLAGLGRGEWAKPLVAGATPFAVIGLIVLCYGVYEQEAVPIAANSGLVGAPTDLYPMTPHPELTFKRVPLGIKREWEPVTVLNWTASRSAPSYEIRMPAGDHAPKSLPCLVVAQYQNDLLTREPLPQEQRGGFPMMGAAITKNAVTIQYWLSGKARDWRKDGVDKGDMKEAIAEFRKTQGGLLNAQLAVDLALSLPEVDPQRIYTAGDQESGLIALLLAEHDDRLRGCIVTDPITDLVAYYGQQRLDELSVDLAEMSHFAIRHSPITHVDKIRCPVFLAQSKNERRAPREQSMAFAEKLRELSKDVVFLQDEWPNEVTKRCQEWLAQSD